MSDQKAQTVQLSEAVAADLSDASRAGFLGPFSFNAEHKTLPDFEREDTTKLRVFTRPRADVRTQANRSLKQHDILIEVTIVQAVKNDESLLADQLIMLAEKIADHWEKTDTTTGQTRTVTGRSERLTSPVETQFLDERLRQHRVIKCVMNLPFRGWR